MNRRLLTVLVSVLGAIGVAATGFVLLRSLEPSETARAKNIVYVRAHDLAPGEVRKVIVGRFLLLIYRPTPEAMADLDVLNAQVWDPSRRSYISELGLFAYLGEGTHLGCVLKEVPKVKGSEYTPQWRGGFLETCGDASYDYAGRRIRNREFALYGYGAELPNLITPTIRVVNDGELRVEMVGGS